MNKNIYALFLIVGLSGCNAQSPTEVRSEVDPVKTACINHANTLATDYELQAMRTGNTSLSETVITMENCRYHFFNPAAKTDTSALLTKENKEHCDALRPEFHSSALQLRQQALDICLSYK